VLRHSASQLRLADMDLLAIQATLGHAWVATTTGAVRQKRAAWPTLSSSTAPKGLSSKPNGQWRQRADAG